MRRIFLLVLLICTLTVGAAAQAGAETEKAESGGLSWFFIVVLVGLALGGAYFLWRKSKKGEDRPQYNYGSRYSDYYKHESYELEGLDAEKELEWLRKAKKSTAKPGAKPGNKITYGAKRAVPAGSKTSVSANAGGVENLDFDTKIFQEKMRKLQYSQLPINSFFDPTPAKLYEPLPMSNDEAVLDAIEQASEEFEEDEAVRELALRVLSAFRTRNSVEALAQIALYDLSSNLRSKAVSSLTDFDHESVFEAMLLACADPTREVRAAAARGLFRLNFDRADAWKRLIETNDEFRMSHAARAAIESGIVVKSFDRLVHEDLKVAYEAFALVSLLIKSGETAEIFDAIKSHKDERVRFALLHVIRVHQDERTLAGLQKLQREGSFPTDVADRIRMAVESFEQVAA